MASTHIHMSVDRLGLIRNLRRGVWKASDIAPGYTKKQLIAELEGMNDRLLPMGEPCEGWTPEKGCPGHRKDDEADIRFRAKSRAWFRGGARVEP